MDMLNAMKNVLADDLHVSPLSRKDIIIIIINTSRPITIHP